MSKLNKIEGYCLAIIKWKKELDKKGYKAVKEANTYRERSKIAEEILEIIQEKDNETN